MRTLQVIETVQELSDLFKEGKLDGCKLWYRPGYAGIFMSESACIELRGTKEYALSKKLFVGNEFLLQMFTLLNLPVYIPKKH